MVVELVAVDELPAFLDRLQDWNTAGAGGVAGDQARDIPVNVQAPGSYVVDLPLDAVGELADVEPVIGRGNSSSRRPLFAAVS